MRRGTDRLLVDSPATALCWRQTRGKRVLHGSVSRWLTPTGVLPGESSLELSTPTHRAEGESIVTSGSPSSERHCKWPPYPATAMTPRVTSVKGRCPRAEEPPISVPWKRQPRELSETALISRICVWMTQGVASDDCVDYCRGSKERYATPERCVSGILLAIVFQ